MAIDEFDTIDMLTNSPEQLTLVITDPDTLIKEDRCYALKRKLQCYKMALENGRFRDENTGWKNTIVKVSAAAEPTAEMKNLSELTFDVDGTTYRVPVTYDITESKYHLDNDNKTHLVDPEYNYQNLTECIVTLAKEYIKCEIFTPFGFTWDRDGETRTIDVSFFPPEQQIDAVKVALQESISKDDGIQAVAVGYDVLAIHPDQSEKTDAIAIDLEHRGGRPLTRIVHYKVVDGEVETLTPYSVPKHGELFQASVNSPDNELNQDAVEANVVGDSESEDGSDDWLESLPTLCFVLIAGADGNIDKKEISDFENSLSKNSRHSNPLVQSIFSAAHSRIQKDLVEILESAKSNAGALLIRLAACKAIAVEKAPEHADEFFELLIEMSTPVAAASGGFMGFGSKIGKQEKTMLSALEQLLRGKEWE
ncbi:MAG TPA: hypothetical protein DDW52_02690 [Planctomycetaceae bacterium]|nr:hypothetical protein [Planctomycetaceae bacterium]